MKTNNDIQLWDEFISYIETMYYPGAIESLESSLIALEYENFKSIYLIS